MEILPELKASYQERLERTLQELRPTQHQERQEQQQQQRASPLQESQPYRFPIEDPSEEIKRAFLSKIMGIRHREPKKHDDSSET